MPTANKAVTYFERGWILHLIEPARRPPQRAIVFIHGWTGDEHSMDVFSRDLPDDALVLIPRGPVSAPSGYGWAPARQDAWPPMSAFEPACRALMQEIELRLDEMGAPGLPVRLVGFSQGGAACHTLTALFPTRVECTAILAGFLPALDPGFDRSRLSGKDYFIAHGSQDDTVPIQMAHESIRLLRQAGAKVEFCESNTGHKLALDCMKKMHAFITRPPGQ